MRIRRLYMSTYLFSKPKVVDGIASVIDLFGVYTIYNESPTGQEADRRAFTVDIQAMQKDGMNAFQTVKKECQKRKNR